ncbi:YheC/YheD family protein, partial [Bradyrhizobium japonicum]|uniref:YheC/YheD family protein n=1 Tax=Bradyrhizobium japonicum TaxID=375 RepID=UPI0009B804E3
AAGSGGRGILSISSDENDHYIVQVKLRKQAATSNDLFSCVSSEILKGFAHLIERAEVNKILAETYIVQYRIPLLEINDCPFDIRVMAQRKDHSPWTVTGKLVKLASCGYTITNVNLGASILPIETALQRTSLKHRPQQTLLSRLDQVALRAAERLQQCYPDTRIIGFDMCFDTEGKVWIIEANNSPHDHVFLLLEDKTMFETIQKYK